MEGMLMVINTERIQYNIIAPYVEMLCVKIYKYYIKTSGGWLAWFAVLRTLYSLILRVQDVNPANYL